MQALQALGKAAARAACRRERATWSTARQPDQRLQ
jgi:hypothetical protein